MVSWPEKIEAKRSEALASSLDIMPTVLRACGIEPPENIPGIDLLDEQARTNRQAVFGGAWSTHNANPGDPQSTLQYRWCVTKKWKLLLRHHGLETTRYRTLHNWDTQPAQLFAIRDDPRETQNVALAEQTIVAKLTRRIDEVIPRP